MKQFAILGVSLFLGIGATASAQNEPMRCEDLTFAVAQAEGGAASDSIAATLCASGTINKKTIQILIHGATYDHHYWDFPYQPETYSYARAMTSAGYAILNVDRVGYGASSHPTSGSSITLHTGAFNIHQIVQALRAGDLVVPHFGRIRAERIELVGFSLGSFIAVIESSTYHDVDGVVLSSYSHRVGSGGLASFGMIIPAQFDPKFPGYPGDYLSLIPGARETLFFHLPNVDPTVLPIDFDLRQTWTAGEVNDIVPSLFSESPQMHVPVLIVDGDYDTIACEVPCTANDWLAGETQLYPPDTCAELEIIPDAGHSLALHRNAQSFFAIVRQWSDRRVGASSDDAPSQPCLTAAPFAAREGAHR